MNVHLFNTASSSFIKDLNALSTVYENHNASKTYTKGAMALCVSKTARIGIDIEQKKTRSPETIQHFIKKFSTFQIKDVPCQISNEWFYRTWTAMESYFKLEGKGFSTCKNFVIDIEQQSIWRDGKKVAWLEYFDTGDFLLCICSNVKFLRQDVQLNYHDWEG